MKLTTILVIGAAALAVPAFAQSANESAAPANNASANQNASANEAAQAPANDASAGAGGKMVMNDNGASATTTGDASAVSSVPDTQKKYRRSNRASDFQKEAETTKQLNQQVASAGGIPKTQQ